MSSTTQVSGDEVGLWVLIEGDPRRRIGIEWSEIFRVSAGCVDGITEWRKWVNLDFEFGEFIELWDDMSGFREAIAALTSHLPGMNPEWTAGLDNLTPGDGARVFWRK